MIDEKYISPLGKIPGMPPCISGPGHQSM